MLDISKLRNSFTQVSRSYSQFVGEENVLTARKAVLETSVGQAKGRIALKPKVDQYLEEMQAYAHSKRVGNLEKLLTALVTEVLPGEAPIGLELDIERGQPSLDIVSRHSADRTEDIYEDEGGAKTNVVSMGLRMVAVVSSRMNRFLMLDESDCWISNKRVPSFYSVLKQAAKKINIQCLAVSHHDIATFGDGISTALLSGHPEMATGVRIENNPRTYQWSDEEEGIRWIRLKNFQGYVDETLYMHPGVNALVGENNIGKSSFIRAFRAVFYGEGRDTLIRRGERICTVEIGFANGMVLHWDRQAKRNPINIWKYLNPDGSVVTEEGMTYETGGRTVPGWVFDIFKIGPVEGLDIHATKQKEPVFLLNKPGSVRAAVLSIGQESGHIRKMITLHKERMTTDAATVKNGEVEMNALLNRLEKLQVLSNIADRLARAEEIIEKLVSNERLDRELQEVSTKLTSAGVVLKGKRDTALTLGALPDRDVVESMTSDAKHVRILNQVATRITEASERSSKARRTKDALANLNSAIPSLIPVADYEAALNKVIKADESHARVVKLRAKLQTVPSVEPALLDVSGREVALEAIASASRRIEMNAKNAAAVANLPTEMPSITLSNDMIERGKAIKTSRLALAGLTETMKSFAAVPSGMPALADTKPLDNVLRIMGERKTAISSATAKRNQLEVDMTAVKKELDAVLSEVGHSCPLCHRAIDDASVLLGHTHNEECDHD